MPQPEDKIKIKQSEIDELYDVEDDKLQKKAQAVAEEYSQEKSFEKMFDEYIIDSDEKTATEFFKKNTTKVEEYEI